MPVTKTVESKKLLIIAHQPSSNTRRLAAALRAGTERADTEHLEVVLRTPFDTDANTVMAADGVLLFTTENFGYMSGALKDFFDRTFYPCLEHTEGLPYCLCIRAGKDGTGTRRAVESIVVGLKWKPVQDAMILQGDFDEAFIGQAEDFAEAFATGLDMGIY